MTVKYYVDIEQWNTQWRRSQTHNFRALPGWVSPGRIDYPVTTDFSKLTLDQQRILAQENEYWKYRQYNAACDLADEAWNRVLSQDGEPLYLGRL